MSDNVDETEGEAAEHDKEVSQSHLVSASNVVAIIAIEQVGILHPSKNKDLKIF